MTLSTAILLMVVAASATGAAVADNAVALLAITTFGGLTAAAWKALADQRKDQALERQSFGEERRTWHVALTEITHAVSARTQTDREVMDFVRSQLGGRNVP